MRPLLTAVALAVVATSCSGGDSGPVAPDPGPTQTVCLPEFCIDYPSDWEIELGEDFVTLRHPLGPVASVGSIDMQGVVVGAGNAWPAGAEDTMRSFWQLLDELGDAELDRLESAPGGEVDSVGDLDGQRLWHRLVPTAPPRAWGAEMRATGSGWEAHADIIVDSLRTPPGA